LLFKKTYHIFVISINNNKNQTNKNQTSMKKEENLSKMKAEHLPKLTRKQKMYFDIMNAKSGVLYITAAPGVAKSATMRKIAEKLDMQYFDIRLSMIDETDVGLYPDKESIDVDGVKQNFLNFIIPKWAYLANTKPTIIHFEELNRASQNVRNAALQILLERQIGTDFRFNNNVLMVSSGNLGEEDNTEVEEFDSALNNRLIHIKHDMPFDEWISDFANEYVHPFIVGYIKSHPEELYVKPTENHRAYATHRTWTFLSDYILTKYGKEAGMNVWFDDVKDIATSYIGAPAVKFIRYCESTAQVNIDNVMEDYDKVRKVLKGMNRDCKSELIQALREKDLTKLNDKQFANLEKFLNEVSDDERVAYLIHVIDLTGNVAREKKVKEFLKKFKTDLEYINKQNDKDNN
jgi:hypothetical protein